jgi:hypothetical protein
VLLGVGAFLLLGASAVLMTYELFLRPGPALTVTLEPGPDGSPGEVIARVPLRGDPTWEVRWQHSVAGIVVRDVFAWRDGQMFLTDTLTPQLDVAGLGHTPGRGELRDDGEGGYWIADLDQPIRGNAYWVRIGSVHAPTVLVHGNREFRLSERHPGVRARIEVHAP